MNFFFVIETSENYEVKGNMGRAYIGIIRPIENFIKGYVNQVKSELKLKVKINKKYI